MNHANMRNLARYVALDRDPAVASADVATILNDHISYEGAMNTDRAVQSSALTAGVAIPINGYSVLLTQQTILKVLSVSIQSSDTALDGAPLDIVKPSDIYHLRNRSTTAGTARFVAVVRMGAHSNRMRLICHPPVAATTYFSVHYEPFEREFTISPLSDTEVTDLPQHAQYLVVREAATDIALILRRPENVLKSIAARVPDAEALTQAMLDRNMAGAPEDRPR